MEDWHPEALAAIADRLGVAFGDLAPPSSRRFRTEGGPSINVLDWGGQGPPAVLLHGGSLTARTWDYVALALRADFRLLALDLRGHGASDWAEDYSMESHASDLVAVVDGLGIVRTRLVGMSLGGMVACEFALCHPDRTESLAMVDVVSRPLLGFAPSSRPVRGRRDCASRRCQCGQTQITIGIFRRGPRQTRHPLLQHTCRRSPQGDNREFGAQA
jgi:pimeloyl-ACP methyl ester carboxylesterase